MVGVAPKEDGDERVRGRGTSEAQGIEEPAVVAEWLFYIRYDR